MSLNRLRWLTIIAAITFLLCVQGIAMGVIMPGWGRIYGHAASITAYSLGVTVFTLVIYRVIDRMQRRIVRQIEELRAVNAVGRAVSGSLDLDQAMTAALQDAIKATRALAGEIIIDADVNGHPRRFTEGSDEDVSRLRDLADGQTAGQPWHPADAGGQRLTSVPLQGQDRPFGVLRLLTPAASTGDGEVSEELLAGIAAQVSMAVHASNLYGEVVRREKQSQALYEIAVDITSFREATSILPSIVERAQEMVGAEAAALCLSRPEGQGLVLAARAGRSDRFVLHDAGTVWRAFTPTGEMDSFKGVTELPSCPLADPAYKRICSPLRVGPSTVGELCVSASGAHNFSREDQRLISAMADLAAIAVQKATLLEKERQVAVLEERERLAREMHDSLAQVLGYLHLKAQDTQRILSRNDLARASDELADMASIAHEAYTDVREAILALREPAPPEGGIAGTLRDYLGKYSRRAGIKTELILEGDWRPQFSPEASVQLVRVIQEALTNVRKHANADRARVKIGRHGNEALIVVEDNGQGFDLDALGSANLLSFGLRTMRERIESVGGRFAIDSVVGEGTKVQIYLPVNGGSSHGS